MGNFLQEELLSSVTTAFVSVSSDPCLLQEDNIIIPDTISKTIDILILRCVEVRAIAE